MDTANKAEWVKIGVEREEEFLNQYSIPLSVMRNPGRDISDYEPDLVVLADLKSVTTPFFMAHVYKMDKQFTVTLNGKDVVRYNTRYPGIIIYFHVYWTTLAWKSYSVSPMNGVWRTSLYHINNLITGGAPLHKYKARENVSGLNAKDSFLFDVRNFERCI